MSASSAAPLSDDHLSTIFAALAHPARRSILGHLTGGPTTTSDLAPLLGLSVGTVRRHVAALAAAGLVDRRRDGRRVLVLLTAHPLEDAAAHLAGFQPFWSAVKHPATP